MRGPRTTTDHPRNNSRLRLELEPYFPDDYARRVDARARGDLARCGSDRHRLALGLPKRVRRPSATRPGAHANRARAMDPLEKALADVRHRVRNGAGVRDAISQAACERRLDAAALEKRAIRTFGDLEAMTGACGRSGRRSTCRPRTAA